jgi:hypothetical protein
VVSGFVHFEDRDVYVEAVADRLPRLVEANADVPTMGMRVNPISSRVQRSCSTCRRRPSSPTPKRWRLS